MRLSDKIIMAEQEIGLVPLLCVETGCVLNTKKYPDTKKYGATHCREQIPYFKNMKLLDLCYHKIEEYWKK